MEYEECPTNYVKLPDVNYEVLIQMLWNDYVIGSLGVDTVICNGIAPKMVRKDDFELAIKCHKSFSLGDFWSFRMEKMTDEEWKEFYESLPGEVMYWPHKCSGSN